MIGNDKDHRMNFASWKVLENLVHIILGTFQSASNSGHWKIYHFGCICGTLLVFLKGIFGAVAKQVAPKDEVDVLFVKLQSATQMGC